MKNKNLFQATRNAINGLSVLLSEKAARRELMLLVAAVALLAYELNIFTILIFTLSCLLLCLEAINTAIERLCDIHTLEFDVRIRAVKDVAAAAIFIVLCSQLALLGIWYASLIM